MYYISKEIEIDAAHKLNLSYDSKCNSCHGHRWSIVIHCKAITLNADGMIVDFAHIKKNIVDQLDHSYLNDKFAEWNTSAENLSRWLTTQIPHCYKAEVWETPGSYACYENDEFVAR